MPKTFSETYLKGLKAQMFLWNFKIRLKGPSVPSELFYRAQGPISFSETYLNDFDFCGNRAMSLLDGIFQNLTKLKVLDLASNQISNQITCLIVLFVWSIWIFI